MKKLVYFQNEWSSIGCGWRSVDISEGYKWVTVTYVKGKVTKKKKFKKLIWAEIAKGAKDE